MTSVQLLWIFLVYVAMIALFWMKSTPGDVSTPAGDVRSPLDDREEQQKAWLELLKLEYQKAADRYENIYRAVWQNFSYMALVAGAILSFAGKGEGDRSPALYFIVLTPLFFWFVASFLPMDYYGESIRKRLRKIEDDINRVYFPQDGDPKLAHFKLFESTHFLWRVKTAVVISGALVSGAWLFFGLQAAEAQLGGPSSGQAAKVRTQPITLEIQILHDSVSSPLQPLPSTDSVLRLQLHVVPRGDSATVNSK